MKDFNPDEDEPRVLYSTDGKGNWHRCEWKRQCPENVFLRGRCQGTEGHKGVHWSYNPSGSFCYSDNDADPTENGCSGSVPPDHKHYRTPLEMSKYYHMVFREESVVTDPDEIARLEREETKNGESVDRPCDKEMIEKFRAEGRLDYPKKDGPPTIG
jgi:hypothetical protein